MEKEGLAELVDLMRELIDDEVRGLRTQTQRQSASLESAVEWLEKIERRVCDG